MADPRVSRSRSSARRTDSDTLALADMVPADRLASVGPELDTVAEGGRPSGGVQSIARAFELLEAMADAGGIVGLSQLAAQSGLPLPTIHRLIRTLVDLGYVRQEPSREYALGPRLVRLGDGASRLLGTWATPHLRDLVDEIGESTNLALLDGDQVVYAAQAPGRHSMRMFTEVGRRAGVHCTAVGKAMLARLAERDAMKVVTNSGLPRYTDATITTGEAFLAELRRVEKRGFAIDDGEQEVGVRCVAVALPGDPVRAGISVSGPSTRMTDELIQAAVPLLNRTAATLAKELHLASATARKALT
jgi:IclR family acetate operon transcriptional repressor